MRVVSRFKTANQENKVESIGREGFWYIKEREFRCLWISHVKQNCIRATYQTPRNVLKFIDAYYPS